MLVILTKYSIEIILTKVIRNRKLNDDTTIESNREREFALEIYIHRERKRESDPARAVDTERA